MPNIGDKQKDKYWSGENYGWQSKATHDKLKQEGKFRAGTQEIDRVVSSGMNWATQNMPGVVSAVSSGLQAVGGAVTFTAQKIKESSPVGEAVVKGVGSALDLYDQGVEFVSEKTNIDKRLVGLAGDAAIGAATGGAFTAAYKSVGTAKGVGGSVKFIRNVNSAADGVQLYAGVPMPNLSTKVRRTRVGLSFPEVAEAASKHIDDGYKYIREGLSGDAKKPLLGFSNFVDPNGEEWVLRPKGKLEDGSPRIALTPLKEKQASQVKRAVKDVASDSDQNFQRGQFMGMHRDSKVMMADDLIAQNAGFEPYIEHGRRINSPFWNSLRAKGVKPGDADNLFSLADPKFKAFKDQAERLLDQDPGSPIDILLDPEIGEIIVEDLRTGKQLGYLDESKPVKAQLEAFKKKATRSA